MKFLRLFIIFIAMLITALLIHLAFYENYFSYETVSNSLFVIGVIMFLPAVAVTTKAYELFSGIRYVFGVLISPQYKAQYPKYSDYKKLKDVEIKTTVFYEIIIASFIIIIISIVFAGLV